MKNWEKKAIELLNSSLKPVPREINQLDWKSDLSNNSERLAQHLSALANHEGGGYLVFGVNNDSTMVNIDKKQCDEILNKLGNISRHNLEPSVIIDHSIMEYDGYNLLFLFVKEPTEKPVYIRGKDIYNSYVRSSGQTRKMTKQEVRNYIAKNLNIKFEYQIAFEGLDDNQILQLIEYNTYFKLSKLHLPENKKGILAKLADEKIIIINDNGSYSITNLGAILFGSTLKEILSISRKAARLIVYDGNDRIKTKKEQLGDRGYICGFEGLIKYINDQLPQNEIINKALRSENKMYPDIAIRELVANALIHQDLQIEGASVMIEIFNNRIEITNPGHPLIDTYRFIDSAPRSRNETLAAMMRRFNICEERGSGIDKVIFECELYQLPAPEFIKGDDYTKVILYSHKEFANMDKNDKIRATYQHCCLKYVNREKMTNQTLRERFKISPQNYPMASRIISDTIDAGLIKPTEQESFSRKYASYIPFWA